MKKRMIPMMGMLCLCLGLLACGGKNVAEENMGQSADQTQAQLTWQAQYDLGIRLLNEGNYEDAILAFQAALSIDPRNLEARVALANVYQQTGQLELALQVLAEADPADGDLAEAYIQLAKQYFQAGDKDSGLRVLQQAVDRLDGEDRDRVLDYAEEKGYVLDENGKLIEFDEAAYLAGATLQEQLEYYLRTGANKDHWCFENYIILNGKETYEITLDEIPAIAASLGWGEMVRDDLDYAYYLLCDYDGETKMEFATAYQKIASADAGHTWFDTIGLGYYGGIQEQDEYNIWSEINRAIREGYPVGVLGICMGDSVETVLQKLGWDRAQEIGAIFRQAQGTFLDTDVNAEAYYIETLAADMETRGAEEKGVEYFGMSYTCYEAGRETFEIYVQIENEPTGIYDGSFHSLITFTFDADRDYELCSVMIANAS